MESLLFVYNASNTFWSKKIDMAHKILSPSTYACDLCALTHGNFTENKTWKQFRESYGVSMEFLYKEDFDKRFPNKDTKFPVVFLNRKENLKELISSKELSKVNSVESLIELLTQKLS